MRMPSFLQFIFRSKILIINNIIACISFNLYHKSPAYKREELRTNWICRQLLGALYGGQLRKTLKKRNNNYMYLSNFQANNNKFTSAAWKAWI